MQAQADLPKASAVEFKVPDEPWVRCKLDDGTLLFGRLIIPEVYRGEDYDPTGQPLDSPCYRSPSFLVSEGEHFRDV